MIRNIAISCQVLGIYGWVVSNETTKLAPFVYFKVYLYTERFRDNEVLIEVLCVEVSLQLDF